MGKQANKLHFRRFEFKYLLDKETAGEIKKDLQHFLIPDPYFEENQGYWIHSLYFDNQSFSCFWEKIDGAFFRKKIRYRIYGKEKDSDIFLEIKRKKGDIVLKDRMVVNKNQIPLLLENSLDHLLKMEKKITDHELLKEYYSLKWQRVLAPVILISYFRQAFLSPYQDLRLTFDRKITCNKVKNFSFGSDNDLEKEILDNAVVFELKFTGSLPYWLYHLIKKYNLRREPISKYCFGIENLYHKLI